MNPILTAATLTATGGLAGVGAAAGAGACLGVALALGGLGLGGWILAHRVGLVEEQSFGCAKAC